MRACDATRGRWAREAALGGGGGRGGGGGGGGGGVQMKVPQRLIAGCDCCLLVVSLSCPFDIDAHPRAAHTVVALNNRETAAGGGQGQKDRKENCISHRAQ